MVTDSNTNNVNRGGTAARKPNPQGLVRALELMELGIELARQQIARQNPGISRADLIAKTNEFLSVPRGGVR
jgi:hypothetical protein